MRFVLLAMAALLATPATAQEQVALVGGRVVTNSGAPLEAGTVLLSAGRVVGVQAAAAPVPAGYRTVDVAGKWVTPGIVAGLTQLGVAEVAGEDAPNDLAAPQSPSSAALELEVAYNPAETSLAVTRIEGVTSAIVAPAPGRSLFAGQGLIVSLAEGAVTPVRPRAFQYIAYGEAGARLSGGSRSAAWAEIVNALDEARLVQQGRLSPDRDQSRTLRITRQDADALVQVLKGEQPLMVRVDRASDIRRVLILPQRYPGLKLVLVSANEGWIVADRIASAGVPVVTLGMDNLPGNFESAGATMSNVGRLVAAGVKVALGTPDLDASFQPRLLPQYAGNMVAQARLPGSAGLTWNQAFAAITSVPAEIFGLRDRGRLVAGAIADVVVWSGDPLELSTHAEQVYVGGVAQSLESRQTKLARRYLPGQSGDRPPAYRR